MIFAEAAAVTLPFGIYQGKTIDQVAATDDGLRYLDWLVGCDWVKGQLADALRTYLVDPTIAAEVDELVWKGPAR